MSDTGVTLDDDLVLSVESVSKRRSDVHLVRYAPTATLLTLLRSRRSGAGASSIFLDDGAIGDDEDDDEGDEGDDEPEESGPDLDEGPEWPLRDVSLSIARGQAVGVVGDESSVSALVAVLVRMTTPTSGRIVHRGRIGLSGALAKALSRRDVGQPKQALHALATVTGIPRRQRRHWIQAVVDFATGLENGNPQSLATKDGTERLLLATIVDPTADVLVIDRVPHSSEAAFSLRFTNRVEQRLAEGAGALVTTRNLDLIRSLCETTVWIRDETVHAIGPTAEILAQYERSRIESKERRHFGAFNADAALFAATLDAEEDGEMRVLVQLETAVAGVSAALALRLDDGLSARKLRVEEPTLLDEPGPYLAMLRLPSGLPSGRYRLDVEATIVSSHGRSSLRRPVRESLAVATDPSAVAKGPRLDATWEALGSDSSMLLES